MRLEKVNVRNNWNGYILRRFSLEYIEELNYIGERDVLVMCDYNSSEERELWESSLNTLEDLGWEYIENRNEEEDYNIDAVYYFDFFNMTISTYSFDYYHDVIYNNNMAKYYFGSIRLLKDYLDSVTTSRLI